MKKRRTAASLFEIIVVMAILVVASAMAVPSLQSMYGSYKLNGAVDSVRAAWAEARARAIEEGRAYRFAVEPEGSSFRVAPDAAEYWDGSGAAPADDPLGPGIILEQSLPSGVRFTVNGEGSSEAPPEPASDSLVEKPVSASANWTPAVIFLPDGTAREDVKILFQIRGVRPTSLQLRGLTGNVTVQAEDL